MAQKNKQTITQDAGVMKSTSPSCPSHGSVVDLSSLRVACADCSLSELCVPLGLEEGDLDRLERIISRGRPVARGSRVYDAGDAFRSLYAIRSGSVKIYRTDAEGDTQIMSFHLPGEIIGVEAIATGTHTLTAEALEDLSLCELPFDRLDTLATQIPNLHHQLLRLMSREVLIEQEQIIVSSHRKPEQRVAHFIVMMSERSQLRGCDGLCLRLGMRRGDLANYLGLALETVSRQLTRLQQVGWIRVSNRDIEILDLDALRREAGIAAAPRESRCAS